MADVGNICRCICGERPQANTTILVSSARGCKDCNTALCLEHFPRCGFAEKHGGAVTVHCIDRSALAPRLAIGSLIVIVAVLVFAALTKDRCRASRRFYDLLGHQD
ncbi:unnamed protein product [Polarella glacialis]|uniref:Uncharacterized protein n=1 Tax=Polarella glacialis TaxID=89957 RepID=A0A813D8T8_POLGL|nr:unnamed protein product [Polarella glacialis]